MLQWPFHLRLSSIESACVLSNTFPSKSSIVRSPHKPFYSQSNYFSWWLCIFYCLSSSPPLSTLIHRFQVQPCTSTSSARSHLSHAAPRTPPGAAPTPWWCHHAGSLCHSQNPPGTSPAHCARRTRGLVKGLPLEGGWIHQLRDTEKNQACVREGYITWPLHVTPPCFLSFFPSESEWRNLTLSGPSSMFTNLYGFVKQQHLPLSCKEGTAKNLFKTILRGFNSLNAAKQSARETLFTGLVYTNSNYNNNKTRSSSFSKFWQTRRVLHGCSATYSIYQVIQ